MPLASVLKALVFLLIATAVEVSGDFLIRIAIYDHPNITAIRIGLFVLGAALVFGYATFLNLAPLEFREVVGLYIATLFVVWQIVNFVFFRTVPTVPVAIGGLLDRGRWTYRLFLADKIEQIGCQSPMAIGAERCGALREPPSSPLDLAFYPADRQWETTRKFPITASICAVVVRHACVCR